jgi:tetratricopeptide (TPR) repeat protein
VKQGESVWVRTWVETIVEENPEAAIGYLEDVRRRVPPCWDVLYPLSEALAASGRKERAEDVLRELLPLDPDEITVLASLCDLLKERGETSERSEILDRLVRQDDSGQYWEERGALRLSRGDLEGALSDCARADQLEGSRDGFSRMLMHARDDDHKAELIAWMLQRDPRCDRAYMERGQLLEMRGDRRGAREDYGRAIDLAPQNDVAYSWRGNLSLNEGRLVDALQDYTRAVELRPTSAWAHVARAEARVEVGDRPGAIEDLEKALGLLRPKSGSRKDIEDYLALVRRGESGPGPLGLKQAR